MSDAKLIAVHSVLPVRDVTQAIAYYTEKLGFNLLFKDAGDTPGYAGVGRDGVELHLQWHDAANFDKVERLSLRSMIDGVDALFAEYSQHLGFRKLGVSEWI
jgi:catechol 2,3-dioxygenase-like lactoylglutathione lyase family enzyme